MKSESEGLVRTTLRGSGRYVFYCDKPLHRRPFGMEGTLVAQ